MPDHSLSARAGTVVVSVFVLLVATALPGLAHVTLSADTTEPGGFAVYTVRVPNESDTAATTSVEVQMPDGFEASRYKPVPGYTIEIAEGLMTIEAADGNPGIATGEFQEFEFQARNPEEAGDLTFPAVQTYDDGEVANWTGPPDADQPAPVVSIGAAAATDEAAAAATEETAADEGGGDVDSDDGDGAGALTWVAIVLGAVGTVVGGVAMFRRP